MYAKYSQNCNLISKQSLTVHTITSTLMAKMYTFQYNNDIMPI